MRQWSCFFVLVGLIAAFNVEAKSPPPGSGKGDVPANVLIMLDTSESMSQSASTNSLNNPNAVAVDSQGNVFVAEYRDHQIKKYNSSGTLLKTWGGYGSGNYGLRYPWRVAVDANDQVYVTDTYNNRVQKFDNDGIYLQTFKYIRTSRSEKSLFRPLSVTVDSNGNVYAGAWKTIWKWNSSGGYVARWTPDSSCSYRGSIYGLSAYGGSIYGVEHTNHRYFFKMTESGVLENCWQTYGVPVRFSPRHIAVTANGIYISGNHYVQKYSLSGVYDSQWGGKGTGDSQFNLATGIGSDSSGNIYVGDFFNEVVKKFDSNGTYLSTIGGPGTSRLDDAKKVIKKLVSNSDLTSGADFGLMEWSDSAKLSVKVSSTGASEIFTGTDSITAGVLTNLDSAMRLAESYFTGADSPINSNAACQKNLLLVISDGFWQDNDASRIAGVLLDSLGIETFVAGFQSGENSNYLKLAKAGGTYPSSPAYVDDWQNLYSTLAGYIRQTISSRQTFSSPVVMPGTETGDYLYQSLFNYSPNHQWKGHLNKYSLDSDGTLGSLIWDAGKKLDEKSETSRKIWTVGVALDTSSSLNSYTTTNLQELKDLMWEGSGKIPTDTEGTDLINFVRGVDAYDEDADGDSTEKRWKLGDIYHSQIKVVGPPSAEADSTSGTDTESYYRQQKNYSGFLNSQLCGSVCAARKEVVYAGSNDGMLHSFDSLTGSELWGFIPPNLLPHLPDMVSSTANTSQSIYGVDGSPIVADVYYGNQWRTVLMSGMGRGGHGYFALDVTDPDQPSFLFAFSNDPIEQVIYHWDATGLRTDLGYSTGVPSEYDYSKLGESWSNPVIFPMPYGSGRKWVAVFGAGFNGGINSNYGSAIYVVDLEDEGKVLKRIDLVDSSGNIANSVPATLTVVTPDTTSKATYKGGLVYVADLEGKLWKLNLTDQGTLYEVTQIFDGQGTQENGRMAYHQVSASVDQKGNFWTFFGTGDQQKLQRVSSQIQNRLYGIKDTLFPQFSAVTSVNVSSLVNSTGSGVGSCPNDSDPGWYVNLESNEKITGKAAIYNETVFASRYTPDSTNPCNPGTGNLSEHDMTCGNPLRNIPLGTGIPTAAVIHKGNVYVGMSGAEKGSETLTEGWVREDNLIIGTPSKPVKGQGSVKIESWREVF